MTKNRDSTLTLIAQRDDGFSLYRRDTDQPDSSWINIKLVWVTVDTKKQRRNWHLSWSHDEQRLSRNTDSKDLLRQHPEVAEWVVAQLRQRDFKAGSEDVALSAPTKSGPSAEASSVSTEPTTDEPEPVLTREQALAQAHEDSLRWEANKQAEREQLEAQREKEREAEAQWRREQLNSYIFFESLGGLQNLLSANRSTSIFDRLPVPRRSYWNWR
ncbi:MAG TPA: hypothetical protein VFB02_16590 [Bradyrhizobium sp.]|nr:hypothetical protein [Bradyrhizobium sp.]